jgi:urease gamma subunit
MEAETVPVTSPSYKSSVQVSRFAANWRLILGTQLFGESQKPGQIIASFLDLAPGGFRNRWWPMEEEVALQNEKVTQRIILKNLREAIKNISPNDYEGSSKGMEASATLQMVKEMFEHDIVHACVTKMVIDDDISIRAAVSVN